MHNMTDKTELHRQIDHNPLNILLYADADLDDYAYALRSYIGNTTPPGWLDGNEPFGAECFDVWMEQRFETIGSLLSNAGKRFPPDQVAQMYWLLSRDNYELIELGRRYLTHDWLNYLHPGLADCWNALSQTNIPSCLETVRLIVEGETLSSYELPELDLDLTH